MIDSGDIFESGKWLYFTDQVSRDFFESWLKLNTKIVPKFLSREEFKQLYGNITSRKNNDGTTDLFLPVDIKIDEVPAILKVVTQTHSEIAGTTLQSLANFKKKLIHIIHVLLLELEKDGEKRQTLERQTLERAIKKYTQLFEQIFGADESQRLSSTDCRISHMRDTIEDTVGEVQEKVDEILNGTDIEKGLLEEILRNAIFETGMTEIQYGLKMMTTADWEKVEERASQKSDGEVIVTREKKLQDQEILLRDYIQIELLKQKLQEAKESGDEQKYFDAQKVAVDILFSALKEFPYLRNEITGMVGDHPQSILKKEIQCVGFSTIAHVFLTELGIQHSFISMPVHATIEVHIGKHNYLFDAAYTKGDKIEEIYWGNKNDSMGFGEFKKSDGIKLPGRRISSFNGVLQSVVHNLSTRKNEDEKLFYLFHKLNLDLSDYDILRSIGNHYLGLGDYKKATLFLKKAVEFYPDDIFMTTQKLFDTYIILEDYEQAIEVGKQIVASFEIIYFFEILKQLYIGLGRTSEFNDFLESLLLQINSQLETNPSDRQILKRKSIILRYAGKKKELNELNERKLLEYLKKVEEKSEDIEIRKEVFLLLRDLERFEDSLDHLDILLQSKPLNIFFLESKKKILDKLGRSEELQQLEQDIKQAYKVALQSTDDMYYKAVICNKVGDIKQAFEYSKKVIIEMDSEYIYQDSIRLGKLLGEEKLGEVGELQKQYLDFLRKKIQTSPGDMNYVFLEFELLRDMGDPGVGEKAQRLLDVVEKKLEKIPFEKNFLRYKAEILKFMGHTQESEQISTLIRELYGEED